jgi:hypothetical protein
MTKYGEWRIRKMKNGKYGVIIMWEKNDISWEYDLCFRFCEVLNRAETYRYYLVRNRHKNFLLLVYFPFFSFVSKNMYLCYTFMMKNWKTEVDWKLVGSSRSTIEDYLELSKFEKNKLVSI